MEGEQRWPLDLPREVNEAIIRGDAELVEKWLARGGNPNSAFAGGSKYTALARATHYKRIQVVRVLLRYGARVDEEPRGHIPPLHRAAFEGSGEIMVMLLAHGAAIDVQTTDFRETALMKSVRQNFIDGIRLLLSRGANCELRELHGKTAEQLVEHNNMAATTLLREVRLAGSWRRYARVGAAEVPRGDAVEVE